MKNATWCAVILGCLIAIGGCGPIPSTPSAPATSAATTDAKASDKSHDHSGWWCSEHGVPEGECSMCSGKVAKEFKAKNDWCEKHDRAKSQCFICDASLMEKYAAKYEAKYGKKPPEPTDNSPAK